MPRRMSSRFLPLMLGLIAIAPCCRPDGVRHDRLGASGGGADAALLAAMADSASWPSYGRDQTNRRYSPLAQVSAATVPHLTLAWRYHTGLPHAFEASPLVADGIMYVSTPLNHVVALDAASGRRLWEHAETLSTTVHCCGPVNRGVAIYGGRIYMGTLDGRLVALDARTGRTAWRVRRVGRVPRRRPVAHRTGLARHAQLHVPVAQGRRPALGPRRREAVRRHLHARHRDPDDGAAHGAA